MKELKAKLMDMHDTVIELEEWVSDRKVKIIKKEEYIILLEDYFVKAIAKSI